MAEALIDVLNSLSSRIESLAEDYKKLEERIKELESENELLKAEISEKDRELKMSQQDVEYLTISHRLADNPDSIISARRHIARLVRTIDNCISMLRD